MTFQGFQLSRNPGNGLTSSQILGRSSKRGWTEQSYSQESSSSRIAQLLPKFPRISQNFHKGAKTIPGILREPRLDRFPSGKTSGGGKPNFPRPHVPRTIPEFPLWKKFRELSSHSVFRVLPTSGCLGWRTKHSQPPELPWGTTPGNFPSSSSLEFHFLQGKKKIPGFFPAFQEETEKSRFSRWNEREPGIHP